MNTPDRAADQGLATEAQARETLLGLCWPDGRRACPRCQTWDPYVLADGRLRCGACRYTFHGFTGRWLNLTGLSARQWIALTQAFAGEAGTREAAAAVGISYNTAFKAFTVLRLAILALGADARQHMGPQTALGEFLTSGRLPALNGKASAPIPVYGILSRGGHVFVDLLPELSAESVLHFNHNFHLRVVRFGHLLLTDRYKTYDALILCGDENLPYQYLLRHTGDIFAESGGCAFWQFAKARLRQFKGLSTRRFPLYLKELELRFNRQQEDLVPLLLAALCRPMPASTAD